jgi:hypothetical protein
MVLYVQSNLIRMTMVIQNLIYSVRYSVVPINSPILTITLHSSVVTTLFITTQNIQLQLSPSALSTACPLLQSMQIHCHCHWHISDHQYICNNCLKITCTQHTCLTNYSLSATSELITHYFRCFYCNHSPCTTWPSHVSNEKESPAHNHIWKRGEMQMETF